MSWYELSTSVELGLIYGIVAIGIYLTFRIIDFADLGVDGSFVLGAASFAVALKLGYSPILALMISSLYGGLAGLCTAILHLYFKLTPLLSGILTAFMLYSINLKIMGGVPNIALLDVSSMSLFMLFAIVLVIILGLSFVLSSDFGLGMRSIGQNKILARTLGINISLMTAVGLILSNALIAFSGAMFAQHQGFADISAGVGTIIIGLAGVMIGEKIMPQSKILGTLASCILGAVLYRIIVAFALHSEWLGLSTQDLNLVTGLLVIAIMLMPKMRLQNA